jgi:hypothetical protein
LELGGECEVSTSTCCSIGRWLSVDNQRRVRRWRRAMKLDVAMRARSSRAMFRPPTGAGPARLAREQLSQPAALAGVCPNSPKAWYMLRGLVVALASCTFACGGLVEGPGEGRMDAGSPDTASTKPASTDAGEVDSTSSDSPSCGFECSTNGGCTNTVLCSGACVDVLADPNNCLGCGKQCAFGQSCAGGVCAPTKTSCPQGTSLCYGACFDLQTDPNNCGGCGHGCGSLAEGCGNGSCG